MQRKSVLSPLSILIFIAVTAQVCNADTTALLQQANDQMKKQNYQQAETIFKNIVSDGSDANDIFKAQEKLIILYILTERSAQAQAGLDKLIADYPQKNELPASLYWIARRYRSTGQDQKAMSLFRKIADEYPGSLYAQKAQLDIPKTNIMNLLALGKNDDAEAAIDRLINDFTGQAGLPEALYDIARQCKENGRYEEVKSLYQNIIQNYPDNSYTDICRLNIPKIDIWLLIDSAKYDQASSAVNSLISNFENHKKLPDTLHGIAIRYQETKQYEKATSLYSYIIEHYPNTGPAERAPVDTEICNILTIADSGDYDAVLARVEKLIDDLPGHWYVPRAISRRIADQKYYLDAIEFEKQGDTEKANENFQKATQIWQIVITRLPDSAYTPEACCRSGDAYRELEQYDKAIQCYQNIVDNYSMYHFRWHALSMLGQSYQDLKKAGLISKSEAQTKTEAAYQQLIATYPDCKAAKYARNWLGL